MQGLQTNSLPEGVREQPTNHIVEGRGTFNVLGWGLHSYKSKYRATPFMNCMGGRLTRLQRDMPPLLRLHPLRPRQASAEAGVRSQLVLVIP